MTKAKVAKKKRAPAISPLRKLLETERSRFETEQSDLEDQVNEPGDQISAIDELLDELLDKLPW